MWIHYNAVIFQAFLDRILFGLFQMIYSRINWMISHEQTKSWWLDIDHLTFLLYLGVLWQKCIIMINLNIPILLRHQTYFRTISTNLWNRILKLFLTLVKKQTDIFWADWLKYIIMLFFLSQGLTKSRRRWEKKKL